MGEKIAIITDSVACIPQELINKYDIEVVPVRLILDGKEYKDGIDITATEFYRILRQNSCTPSSAGAVPGDFIEAFEKLGSSNNGIFCITISHKFSGMYESALEARDIIKKTMPEVKIEIFDSGTAAAAQGFIVLAAARSIATGKNFEEVFRSARDVAENVHLLGILDTMKYLSKSGRVPKAAALASSVLKIKPVFALRNGDAFPIAKNRTLRGAISCMLNTMGSDISREKVIRAAVMHADSEEQAIILRDEIAKQFNCSELFITEFTPVIGAYAGPGVLALAYYNE